MTKNLDDLLDDLIVDYGDGPELAYGITSRLNMAKRGKYGHPELIIRNVIADLRMIADELEAAL